MVSRTKPDTLVAIRPNSVDWILAKVLTHDPTTGMYTLSDEDADSNKGEFCYPTHYRCYDNLELFDPVT